MEKMLDLLKAISEENRLRILFMLEQAGELSVQAIGDILQLSQPKVSRHLARMRLAGLVKERKWKGFSLYRIALPHGNIVREFILQLIEEMEEDTTVASDFARLIAMMKVEQKSTEAEITSGEGTGENQ